MQSTALVVRIGNETFDAGQLLQKLNHRRRVEIIEELLGLFPQFAADLRTQFFLTRIIEFNPLDFPGIWKFFEYAIQNIFRKNSLHLGMGEGIGLLVGIAEIGWVDE